MVDGLINESVVRVIAEALLEDERAVVCGTAIDAAAGELLRELRPGSSVRKIPASILARYRQGARWIPHTAEGASEGIWQPTLDLGEALEA